MSKALVYVKWYILNLLDALDDVANALIGGSPDQGLTARLGMRQDPPSDGFIDRAKQELKK